MKSMSVFSVIGLSDSGMFIFSVSFNISFSEKSLLMSISSVDSSSPENVVHVPHFLSSFIFLYLYV